MDLELIEKQLKHAISIVQEMKSSQNGKTANGGTLKSLLIEVVEMVDADSDTDYESDIDSLSSDYDSDSDASFTEEESTYIKNESHRAYLKRYSLKPQFPLHYFNADRDK
jgi:hypothetical protein